MNAMSLVDSDRRHVASRKLNHRHRAHPEASGLTAESIAASGCYSEEGGEIKTLQAWPETSGTPSAGLVIPYPDADGYVQVRLDRPRLRGGTVKVKQTGTDHAADVTSLMAEEDDLPNEVIKYEKPLGSRNRIYIPPVARERLAAGETPWITEGEKKALLGCQCGLAMVAVSGITCFGDSEIRELFKGIGVLRAS